MDLEMGIIIGILLWWVFWVAGKSIDTEKIQEKIRKKLPHKMGQIVGLSSEEQDFQDSLKSDLPKKIN